MRIDQKPLLVRTHVYPDESLPSLCARLAKLNAYEPSGLLKTVCLDGTTYRENFGSPYVTETYSRLEALTQIDAARLYEATPHRLTALVPTNTANKHLRSRTLKLPNNQTVAATSQTTIAQQVRSSSAAQFCPVCLQTAAYHRLAWQPLAVSACIEHECLLESLCPSCQRHVSIEQVVTARCERCNYDLRNTPTTSIAHDHFGFFSQRVIQWWLDVSHMPALPWPYLLLDQPQSVCYGFLDDLSRILLSTDSGWRFWHRIGRHPTHSHSRYIQGDQTTRTPLRAPTEVHHHESGTLYCLYATAFKAMIDWPTGFYEFLRAYRFRDDVSHEIRIGQDLGRFYTDLLCERWQNGTFGFARDAFEDYLRLNYTLPILAEENSYRQYPLPLSWGTRVSIEDAARLLGLPYWATSALVHTRALSNFGYQGTNGTGTESVDVAEVLELRSKWRAGVPLDQVKHWLGNETDGISRLVKSGRLEIEQPRRSGRRSQEYGPKLPTLCWLTN